MKIIDPKQKDEEERVSKFPIEKKTCTKNKNGRILECYI